MAMAKVMLVIVAGMLTRYFKPKSINCESPLAITLQDELPFNVPSRGKEIRRQHWNFVSNVPV